MLDLLKEKEERSVQINRILTRLFEIWKKYPNLKFNQLIYYINSAGEIGEQDFFFITDEEFEEDMERATSTGGQLTRGEDAE
jgi:hypothetical protein